MFRFRGICLILLVPVFLLLSASVAVSVTTSADRADREIGVELGYFNQSTIYGKNTGPGFNYPVEASSPTFVFSATFNNMWGDTSTGYFGDVYPRGFLKFKVNDFFTVGFNLGYLKDSFEKIDYVQKSSDYRRGDFNGDSWGKDDRARIICSSIYTTHRSISIMPMMGEVNIKMLNKEKFSLGSSFSFGLSTVKITDEIDIENSITQEVDYSDDGTIDVTTPTKKTSENYTIEDSKKFPTAEISLLCKSNISKKVSATIGGGIQLLHADFGYKKQPYDDLKPKDWEFGKLTLSGLHIYGGLSTKF